jgi:hypothetical protein
MENAMEGLKSSATVNRCRRVDRQGDETKAKDYSVTNDSQEA